MKKKSKRRLDGLLWALSVVANSLARFLSPLIQSVRSTRVPIPASARSVTVAKFEGIGSMVYAGHLCNTLRKGMPELERITFLTTKGNSLFASRLQGVTNVIALDDSNVLSLLLSSVRLLHKCRSDVYIDLEVYSNFSALFCTATFSWWRVGFFRQSANVRTGMFTHSVFFNLRKHIVYNYLQTARALRIPLTPIVLSAPRVDESDRVRVRALLNPLSCKKFIGINPNASDLLIERRWPPKKFAECMDILAYVFPAVRFLIFGTKSELMTTRALHSHLSEEVRTRTLDLTAKLEIGELLAALSYCDVLITNDSGPMHLAFSLDVPTVSLWGPGDPDHYGPLNHNTNRICRELVFCAPCIYQTDPPPCRGQNICMQRLSVANVVQAVVELFSSTANRQISTPVSLSREEFYPDGRAAAVAADHFIRIPLHEN